MLHFECGWFLWSVRASYNSDWPHEVCWELVESIQSHWIDSLMNRFITTESIHSESSRVRLTLGLWIDLPMNRFSSLMNRFKIVSRIIDSAANVLISLTLSLSLSFTRSSPSHLLSHSLSSHHRLRSPWTHEDSRSLTIVVSFSISFSLSNFFCCTCPLLS